MKRKYIPIILFIFVAVILYINCYIQEKDYQYQEFITIGQTDNSMAVFFSTESEDDMNIYHAITDALDRVNGSLYCINVDNKEGKETYSKYVYVNDTGLFDKLSIQKGRFFEHDEMEGQLYLSSVYSDDVYQIGVINSFDKNMNFQIRTMYDYVMHHREAFKKTFILEINDRSNFKVFQNILREEGIVVSEGKDDSKGSINISPFITAAILAMLLVLMLILFYDLIKSYKQIGIEKLLGYDTFGIWSSRIVSIVFWEVLVIAVVVIILSLILLNGFNILTYKFLTKMILYYIGVVIFTLCLLSVPFLYVEKIPVYSTVKNQKPLKEILLFNFFVKGIATTLLCIVLFVAWTQVMLITNLKYNKYDNWDKMRSFAYIYEECYKEVFFDSFSEDNMEKWKLIYHEFNKNGGVLADFSSYSPLNKEEYEAAVFPSYHDVTVNPNYIKLFPIFDEDGNIIEISERDEDYIILVPEKYKKDEQMLLSYYKDICESEDLLNKNIRIIWIKDGQKLFSCALDIGIDNYNTVEDTIVIVLTEKNGYIGDYTRVVAYTGNPFKVRVNNTEDLQLEINNVLLKYFGLDDVWFPATSVYDAIEDQTTMANNMLMLYSVLSFVLLVITIAIIIQSIMTYISQCRRVLAIKKLLGYGMLERYTGYFAGVLICYLMSVLVALVIKEDVAVLVIGSFMLASELICSLIYITVKEQKNIIYVTKGDL